MENSKAGNHVLLILFNGHGAPIIDRSLVKIVTDQFEDVVQGNHVETIDIWIDSPGGDAHAAFKLASYLRDHCQKIRTVIPDFAKSAATLLALAADEIYMSAGAELGPLDAQVMVEGQIVEGMSAHNVAGPYSTLARLAIGVGLTAGQNLTQQTGLARSEIVSPAMEFAASTLEPLLRQIDPKQVHRMSSLLEVTVKYSEELISRHNNSLSKPASAIAHELVFDFPDHGFVIDRKIAKDLGLPIFRMEDYELRSQVKELFDAFHSNQTSMLDIVIVEAQDGAEDAEHTQEQVKLDSESDRATVKEIYGSTNSTEDSASGQTDSGEAVIQ